MRCRTLVIALALLVSPPALAQAPGSDGGTDDSGPAIDSGLDAGAPAPRQPRPALAGLRDACRMDTDGDDVIDAVGECQPVPGDGGVAVAGTAWTAGPRWTVGLETVVGEHVTERRCNFQCDWASRPATAASALASLRFRPTEQLSVGVVLPLAVAVWRMPSLNPRDPAAGGDEAGGNLGNIGVFAGWEARLGRTTRLPVGLAVVLPTSFPGDDYGRPGGSTFFSSPASGQAAVTRGLEDFELFVSGYVSVVPSVAVSQRLGWGDVSASLKVPLLLRAFLFLPGGEGWVPTSTLVACQGVVSAQVLLRIVDSRRTTISAGMRGFLGGGLGYKDGLQTWGAGAGGAGLEPRAEATFGGLALRAGLVVSFAGASFPEAWGVRVGVGYSF